MEKGRTPIVMAEEFWANTQLSIVRHFGCVNFNGHQYVIVNKDGLDIFVCSHIAEKEGREKAIEPGEPCDLCRMDFVPIYLDLGRDRFLEFIKAHPQLNSVKEAKELLKQWTPTK